MNRQANLLYLQNLRDLEVAREKLKKIHADYLSKNVSAIRVTKDNAIFCIETPFEEELSFNTRKEPKKPVFLQKGRLLFTVSCCLLLSALFVAGICFLKNNTSVFNNCIVLSLCFALYPVAKSLEYMSEINTFKSELSQFKTEVKNEKRRIQQQNSAIRQHNSEIAKNNVIIRQKNQTLKQQIDAEISRLLTLRQKHNAWYEAELGKLNTLISDFYNMNVLPNSTYHTWRGLAPVCYIYDVLSTTTELTLKDVLFSQQFEAGIQRLEAKMDTMIGQLGALVYETRCIKQNTDILIQQNEEMLIESSRNMNTLIEQNKKQVHSVQELEESIKRNEQYTLEAAQYASLSANYAKANAYFALAEYLKN